MLYLYKFYNEIWATNLKLIVRLVENNVSSHSKEVEICKKDREEKEIKKVDWPTKLLNLHFIEEVWFYINEILKS